MRKAARGVYFLSFIQLICAVAVLFMGGLLYMFISIIFVSLGIAGACKKNPRLLVAHFVYSLVVYIFTLITIIAMIVYCDDCTFWSFLFAFVFLIFQALGMRQSRILIGYARLYPNSGCGRACQRRCESQQQTAQTQTQQIQEQAPQAPQAPVVPVAPQFYPVPQMYQVPQPYMPVSPFQPMRYASYPTQQGIPMMPMGMQYVAYPQPVPQQQQPYPQSVPQQQQQDQLYPQVPQQLYRQV